MRPINLLPWRELERKKRGVYFFITLMLIVMIIVFISVLIRIVLMKKSNEIQRDIKTVKEHSQPYFVQLTELKALKVRQKKLESQLNFANELHGKNTVLQNFFVMISTAIPEGVYLTHVEYTSDKIILTGKADSNLLVNQFLHNVQLAKLLGVISLKSVEHHENEEKFFIVLESSDDEGQS